MTLFVQIAPSQTPVPELRFTWDADTDILAASLTPTGEAGGVSGSVGLQGTDGSWVILDVGNARIQGVEVVVWPNVQNRTGLVAPSTIENADVVLRASEFARDVESMNSSAAVALLEMTLPMIVETDPDRRTYRFRMGRPRRGRTVRVATGLLIDVDDTGQFAGLWLLNVPPCRRGAL